MWNIIQELGIVAGNWEFLCHKNICILCRPLWHPKAFVSLHYILILMDDADGLCKKLWKSNYYLWLLQSTYRGNLLQFPYVTLGKSLSLSHLNEGKIGKRISLDYTASATTEQHNSLASLLNVCRNKSAALKLAVFVTVNFNTYLQTLNPPENFTTAI